MIKKWGMLYLSCNYSCTLHLLVKELSHFSMLEFSYGTTKQKTKMKRVQRWWD